MKMREIVLRSSSICSLCGEVIDLSLKSICRLVPTEGYTVADAHLIPLYCGDECRRLKHQRKASPWSGSVDHVVPVSKLPPGSPLLTDPRNGAPAHLICNQRKQAGDKKQEGPPLLKSWF